MISTNVVKFIRSQTLQYWEKEVTKDYFIDLAQGKEIGHKLADIVDEKTVALLKVNHFTGQQRNARGEVRARSMGDVWLKDNEIYNAINVKVGIAGHEGQPNLVSLKKVIRATTGLQIDCYFLLIVKFSLVPPFSVSVIFDDMLDWLDYVTFDAGPGQIMLKAKKFFDNYDVGGAQSLQVAEKVERLLDLYEGGHERLLQNRAGALKEMRESVDRFRQIGAWAVTPNSQQALQIK